MNYWGKIIGAFLGFMLGGPIGVLFGIWVGHRFDEGISQNFGYSSGFTLGDQQQIQTIFFSATFSVMGHVAKADGVVTQNEIHLANRVMDEMRLNETMRQNARQLFAQGKSQQFQLETTLTELRNVTRGRKDLLLMFVEIQIRAANADGTIEASERRVLMQIIGYLNISAYELNSLISRHQAHKRYESYQHGKQKPSQDVLSNAYAVLGIKSDSSEAEVKKAYRKLMSQHHPDKLVAKGLPEEMLALATEKTQEIQSAYDLIKGQQK